jgi:TRAP-type C4-dicarboxylate transport system permease small subunit
MIGAGAVSRRGAHIRVDAGIDALPEHWRRIALTIADALVVVVVAALVYYTVITIKLSATMRTATMALPFTVMFFPLLLGGGLILLHTVVGMARRWGAVSGQAPQEHGMEGL